MNSAKVRVLISEPNAEGYEGGFGVVLPYMWAILKSHWERHGTDRDAVSWLDPMFDRNSVLRDLDRYKDAPPDIVGLSCYTWNWGLQGRIAQWAKQANPNCKVIAGGPDPDYKDPQFFIKYPYIDAVAVKDGETTFTSILDRALRAQTLDFREVPGLYLPNRDRLHVLSEGSVPHHFTGPAEQLQTFDYSPYIDQSGTFERIISKYKLTTALFETNRGCPYSCSFCDWGSSIMSKVRKFDMPRIDAEMDWFGRVGVKFIFFADANFGIFPRDIEIMDRMAAVRDRYGCPTELIYSSAKNNPDRVVAIAKKAYASKFTTYHTLAVQHTDEQVLASIERSNIPAAKYREVVSSLSAAGVPSETQLIMGIPGDTPEKWKRCLGEIMDWGAHDNYQVSPFTLLPNAPASDPDFLRKWKIDTIERVMCPYGGIRMKDRPVTARSKIVVGSSTFSQADWVEMNTYTAFVRAFHNRALTRWPALYLRFVHNVPYREFYGALVDGFFRENEWGSTLYNRVRSVFSNLIRDAGATDEMDVDGLPDCPLVLEPARWINYKVCRELDRVFEPLTDYFVTRYPHASGLRSAFHYQQQLVITPDYQPSQGKAFRIDRDWPAFLQKAVTLTRYEPLPEPDPFLLERTAEIRVKAIQVRANDLGDATLDFGTGTPEERWMKWIFLIGAKQNVASYTNFTHLNIRNILRPWKRTQTGTAASLGG